PRPMVVVDEGECRRRVLRVGLPGMGRQGLAQQLADGLAARCKLPFFAVAVEVAAASRFASSLLRIRSRQRRARRRTSRLSEFFSASLSGGSANFLYLTSSADACSRTWNDSSSS